MRLFIADGTPEELERASRWLRNLIEDGKSGPAVASRPASPASDGGALDPAIEAWFNERFPDPEDEHRIQAMQFLTAVWDLGPDVHIQPGRKSGGDQTAKPYLFAKGARGRAFVYFRPLSGVARFDLPPE